MLIFDRFSDVSKAQAFADRFGGSVHMSQVESDKIDPFPYQLDPPIVLIDRDVDGAIDAVARFGGSFAGT